MFYSYDNYTVNNSCLHTYVYVLFYVCAVLHRMLMKDPKQRPSAREVLRNKFIKAHMEVWWCDCGSSVCVCVRCVCLCWSRVSMLQCPALICRIWAKKWHWSCRAHRQGMQRKKQRPLHKLCELLCHATVFLCLIVLMDVKSWYFLPHIHHMSFSYGACADFMFFVLWHFLTVDSCCVGYALWTL